MRAALLTFTPKKAGDPPPKKPTQAQPITVLMDEKGKTWLFDSPEYLAPLIEAMKNAE